jgi:hypothetical protein
MTPLFIGMALPPNESLLSEQPQPSSMKPPPVTQQPPSEGGLQSAVLPSGMQAPHGAMCVPGAHVGALQRHVALPPLASQW